MNTWSKQNHLVKGRIQSFDEGLGDSRLRNIQIFTPISDWISRSILPTTGLLTSLVKLAERHSSVMRKKMYLHRKLNMQVASRTQKRMIISRLKELQWLWWGELDVSLTPGRTKAQSRTWTDLASGQTTGKMVLLWAAGWELISNQKKTVCARETHVITGHGEASVLHTGWKTKRSIGKAAVKVC